MKKFLWITVLVCGQIALGQTSPNDISAHIKTSLASHLTGPFKKTVTALYSANGHKPLWVGEANTQYFFDLLDALSNPLFNYKQKSFNQKDIKYLSFNLDSDTIAANKRASALARLDILMSDSFVRLIHFVRVGDVDWALVKKKLSRLKVTQDVHAAWEIRPKSMPSVETILRTIKRGTIKKYLSSLLPQKAQYRSLITLLDKYKRMPKFPKIAYGNVLKPGSNDRRIRQIKKLLQFTGDFPKNSSTGFGYGKEFTKAIRSFRERYNLAKRDYVDNKTVLYLNTSKSELIKKILVNLDRLKLYPGSFGSDYIQVNVPDYKLSFIRQGKIVFQSDIVVGRIDRPTPLFSSAISHMVLNPTWTITDNLVRRDLIPVLRKNPNFLKENDIHVFNSYKPGAKEVTLDFNKLAKYEHNKKAIPYRFVQFPGEHNALGRVKFMFPNKYSVYLHDTDNKSLFNYRYRPYSSGCMRVKKPFDMMQLLLEVAGNGYSSSTIEKIFATNKPKHIRLKNSIPVHIVYMTSFREKGKDHFLFDVYMYDQIIWESTQGHKKATFIVPKKRLTEIKRGGARIRVKKKQ